MSARRLIGRLANLALGMGIWFGASIVELFDARWLMAIACAAVSTFLMVWFVLTMERLDRALGPWS